MVISVFSVVIPAYNEEGVIGACLESLLADYKHGEFEVVVVANGCTDKTVEIALGFGDPVRVIELAEGNKAKALNRGDSEATGFPRMYVDADIRVSTAALRAVASVLKTEGGILLAAPRGIVDNEDRSLLVRAFLKVWTHLPYFQEGPIGAGFFAFSREGRQRFGAFPDIIADDGYARLMVAPHERACVSSSTFTITPPRSLAAILGVMTRVRAGSIQLREEFPELLRNESASTGNSLQAIASQPSLWPYAPVYLAVVGLSWLQAFRKIRANRVHVWERDETSRRTTLSSTDDANKSASR